MIIYLHSVQMVFEKTPPSIWSKNSSNLIVMNCLPMVKDFKHPLSFCLMNTQSMTNKSADIFNFVCEHKIDLLAITKTWLNVNDDAVRNELPLTNYKLCDHPALIVLVVEQLFFPETHFMWKKWMMMYCFITVLLSILLITAFSLTNYHQLGLNGTALDWFWSYLFGCSQWVSVQRAVSDEFDLWHGVPQGSCLGPLLFTVHASTQFNVVEKHLPTVHYYCQRLTVKHLIWSHGTLCPGWCSCFYWRLHSRHQAMEQNFFWSTPDGNLLKSQLMQP